MTPDRKNLLMAFCFVAFAIIECGLFWLLKQMSLDFIAGFVCAMALMAGLFGIISKDFRNLS